MMKLVKIVTFVPIKYADKIRQAMGNAGAGLLGNYHHASFSTKGIGRFIPSQGARPVIGKVGEFTEVEEEKIEVICDKEKVKNVLSAIKSTHPYEEVPMEIYQLVDENEI